MALAQKQNAEAFKIKGFTSSVSIISLETTDITHIENQLKGALEQAPKLFGKNLFVLDLIKLQPFNITPNFSEIQKCFNRLSLTLIGIQNATEPQKMAAKSLGLSTITFHQRESAKVSPEKTLSQKNNETKIIHKNIRSGQQIYAKNKNLLILGSVSQGAEIIADGNITVLGALRGKALAGVNGQKHASITCQALLAELISIAGIYKMHDDYKDKLSLPAHVSIQDNKMQISTPIQQNFQEL